MMSFSYQLSGLIYVMISLQISIITSVIFGGWLLCYVFDLYIIVASLYDSIDPEQYQVHTCFMLASLDTSEPRYKLPRSGQPYMAAMVT